MSFLPLTYPPGLRLNSTPYATKGRMRDANLVRWHEGSMRPVGPWRSKTSNVVTGAARAMITWRTNTDTTYAGIGTHLGLFVMDRTGAITDITPAGFTTGRADAVTGGGYGIGLYGAGLYGVTTADDTLIQDASVWSLDTWGEDLVGVMDEDGIIYEWALDTGLNGVKVTNSPSAKAILVTEEEFLLALGAGGNHREIDWCDQADNTTWAPSATNQAGSFVLQTQGHIICGKRVTGGHLIFTSVDVWRGTYLGPPLVFGFERIGSDCGIVAIDASVVAGATCYWMGLDSFWSYNGYVSPLACEISDRVFGDLNRVQASKVQAFHNSQFGEVWWFYASAESTEIDTAAAFNYRENTWDIHTLSRTCMADRGVFNYPLMINASGAIFEHEVPFAAGDYDSADVFAETAPIELGNGDRIFFARQFVPDELTAGDVTVTFKTRMYPNGAETTLGPYSAASPIPLRFCARQVQARFTGAAVADWRVGVPRLEVTPGGLR